jgi:hypothetical protein
MSDLNPANAFIFRITHIANLPWILEKGKLDCRNSPDQDPNFVNIGSVDLINKRARRQVPLAPGGTLSDYVPFYFTPFSIMMYNIKTGYGGITRRENGDIVIFVSSVHRLRALNLPCIFTNQHAYPVDTEFYSSIEDLKHVDWLLLQKRDFKTNDADPGKQSRYQAEALVHRCVPLEAMLGICCYNAEARRTLQALVADKDAKISVKERPSWYF